jgi:hypothetical protein
MRQIDLSIVRSSESPPFSGTLFINYPGIQRVVVLLAVLAGLLRGGECSTNRLGKDSSFNHPWARFTSFGAPIAWVHGRQVNA